MKVYGGCMASYVGGPVVRTGEYQRRFVSATGSAAYRQLAGDMRLRDILAAVPAAASALEGTGATRENLLCWKHHCVSAVGIGDQRVDSEDQYQDEDRDAGVPSISQWVPGTIAASCGSDRLCSNRRQRLVLGALLPTRSTILISNQKQFH